MLESNYTNWEKQVSDYLKIAIANPEKEVFVCEMLCELMMDIVQDERAICKEKTLEAIRKLGGISP